MQKIFYSENFLAGMCWDKMLVYQTSKQLTKNERILPIRPIGMKISK